MVQETLIVHHNNWGEIRREDWNLVLDCIPVGEYVEDIPFTYPEHLTFIKLLKHKRPPTYSVDLHRVDIEYDTMEFRKILTASGAFIWERLR